MRPRTEARWVLAGLLLLAAVGCNRAYYRRQADQDAYNLVESFSVDPRWPLEDYTIQPPAASRMYDPGSPDCPPMPPDDPAAHQFMHCVDCKKGSPCWHRNGDTPFVENPYWRAYLPLDKDGNLVLDRQAAVQTALLQSRDYQTQLENLYLSALDVSFERFRFDVQFFAGNTLFFDSVGRIAGERGTPRSTLGIRPSSQTGATLQARKLLASGGELVVGLANTLVWQFSGPDQFSTNSVLDFSLVQPLLRGGGRAVALESLTDSERALLSNVRQMERYRRGFYTQIVAGRNPGPGPSAGDLPLGVFAPGGGLGVGGFLALLSDQVRIRNQRQNVTGLQSSLDQIEAFYDAGRSNRYQVDLARQSLYDAQSQLITITNDYEDDLDAYKIILGLPPDLNVRISDPLLERFDLIAPSMTAAQEETALLVHLIGDPEVPLLDDYRNRIIALEKKVLEQMDLVLRDRVALDRALPERRKALAALAGREEIRSGDVDPSVVDIAVLDRRVVRVGEEFGKLQSRLQATVAHLDPLVQRPEPQTPQEVAPLRETIATVLTQLAGELRELAIIQAASRIDAITLVPVNLDSDKARKIASLHRLDWMNARAALVDQWRQIAIAANALKSDLNLVFSGDIGTVDNNPARFRSANGRLRVGAEFDAPLTRLVERNAYRATLIAYQRAQRDYYEYVDLISQVLRRNLRTLQLSNLAFELRRATVFVAISQVESAGTALERPPKVGETSQLPSNTARDLTQALATLLRAQNTFLAGWVDYEAQRMFLDLDLGTMQLDRHGMWVDPGPIGVEDNDPLGQPEEIPPGMIELPPPPLPAEQ